MPKVSVLMSVYNGIPYLQEAVDGILAQTFTDFEFIIVDDGSSDETPAVLDRYTDSRIVRLRNESNLGLTRSLNCGLAVARGEYVARQDADDVSLLGRLARQVSYLDSHPHIALVGTAYVEVREASGNHRVMTMPLEHKEISMQLFYQNCFCHGSVMARRACLEAVGGYDEQFEVAQDRDLWLRLAEHFELANLPEPLYHLRISSASITGRHWTHLRQAARQAVLHALQRRSNHRSSSLAVGRFYWQQVLDELGEGNREAAVAFLHRAVRANQHLDDDAVFLAQAAVHRAFEIGPAGLAHTKSSADTAQGVSFLDTLFDLLPPEMQQLGTRRNWALGELHAAYAFSAFESGRSGQTRLHCITAWFHHWSHFGNCGLLSVFLRSFLPYLRDTWVDPMTRHAEQGESKAPSSL